MRIDPGKASDKMLLLLLAADVVLILLHVAHLSSGFFADLNYSIAAERGFGETFQYLKEGWIVLMFAVLGIRSANGMYASWTFLFGVLLVDDAFAARERIGKIIGLELDFASTFGLRPQDLGELIVIGLFAASFIVPIVVEYVLSREEARSFWRSMLWMLVALAAFGVLFDMIHITLLSHPVWENVLQTTEEAGEMIVMSFIVRFVFQAWHVEPTGGRPFPDP
ncbi:MAG: hypothetical protein ABR593_12110 [Candidatus Limnocylindria bacterium]